MKKEHEMTHFVTNSIYKGLHF